MLWKDDLWRRRNDRRMIRRLMQSSKQRMMKNSAEITAVETMRSSQIENMPGVPKKYIHI